MSRTPWLRLTLISIGLSFLIHVFFGFSLDFSVDEAHYALYGLNLDWSYFDHPPLIGWIQALPIQLNFSVGFIRLLLPGMIWFFSILMSLALTRLILDTFFYNPHDTHFKSAIAWTAFCLISAPLIHVLAVGLLPDTLLLLIVPSMMWLTIQIHHQLNQTRPRDFGFWVLLGIVLGLAALSKYTSIFFALAIPVCLMSWHGLRIFSRPGLWLCLIIAGAMTTPILYWNITHDWISFTYQFAHGSGGEWQIKRLGIFLLNQFICFGILSLMGVMWCFRRHLNIPVPLLSFFFVPFLFFLLFSGGGSSLPHWTSPSWIALAPIAGIGLSHAWSMGRKFWIKAFLTLQILSCMLGFTFLFTGGIPGVSMQDELGKKNPIADLYGWSDAGDKILVLAKTNQIEHLVVQNWTLGSRLAWYARPLPVHILDERVDQFDIWFGQLPKGADALLLNWSQMSFSNPVSSSGFASCEKLDTLVVTRMDRDISQFDFLLCKNWQGSFTPKRNDFEFTLPKVAQELTDPNFVNPLDEPNGADNLEAAGNNSTNNSTKQNSSADKSSNQKKSTK